MEGRACHYCGRCARALDAVERPWCGCERTLYRVRFTHRAWVGKSDPGGHGRGSWQSHCRAWLGAKSEELQTKGCRCAPMEKQRHPDAKWEKA